MFRGTFTRAARTVPELRNGHSVRTSAIAGLAEAEPHVNEGHDEWVKTDVVNDGEGWTARFSDITTEELRNAAASMGLVRRTRQAPTEELEADSSVEEIDADAQMREVQSGDAWAVHNAFPSVTEFAMQMAQRPSIQRAILEEIRADEELRLSFERLSRRHGVELRLLPLSGGSPALIGASDDEGGAVDKDTHPLEALFNGLLNAAEAAGAAIGTYVKRMLQHILSLGRLLRGKRASTADGVVFDDESAVAVNKAQVMLDMSLAVASLLVLVAVLGRVGARVLMRP